MGEGAEDMSSRELEPFACGPERMDQIIAATKKAQMGNNVIMGWSATGL